VTVGAVLDVTHAFARDLKLDPAVAEGHCAAVRAIGAGLFPLAVVFGAPPAEPVEAVTSKEEGAQDA
jgi:hypothetical protein